MRCVGSGRDSVIGRRGRSASAGVLASNRSTGTPRRSLSLPLPLSRGKVTQLQAEARVSGLQAVSSPLPNQIVRLEVDSCQ
jgi:hypothetical protein